MNKPHRLTFLNYSGSNGSKLQLRECPLLYWLVVLLWLALLFAAVVIMFEAATKGSTAETIGKIGMALLALRKLIRRR